MHPSTAEGQMGHSKSGSTGQEENALDGLHTRLCASTRHGHCLNFLSRFIVYSISRYWYILGNSVYFTSADVNKAIWSPSVLEHMVHTVTFSHCI